MTLPTPVVQTDSTTQQRQPEAETALRHTQQSLKAMHHTHAQRDREGCGVQRSSSSRNNSIGIGCTMPTSQYVAEPERVFCTSIRATTTEASRLRQSSVHTQSNPYRTTQGNSRTRVHTCMWRTRPPVNCRHHPAGIYMLDRHAVGAKRPHAPGIHATRSTHVCTALCNMHSCHEA